MDTEKYKDRRYRDTIIFIKDILQKLQIETEEFIWEHNKGFFTTMVKVKELNISTCGKGCSKEQAFASAYGEFMERIQNLSFYKFKYHIPEGISEKLGIYYAPDEKLIGSFDEMKFDNEVDEVIDIVMNQQQEELLSSWIEVHSDYEKKHRKFLALPFRNYMTKDLVYFPAKLLVESYGTNGMSAGNSFSEALVQGISEIFERYANKLIYTKKIVPPIIPREFLNTNAKVMNMISELENEYKIEVRDCSLGFGLPIIGLYVFDSKNGKYYVKFGSHPILSIAVERCITELYQGRGDHNKLTWLQDISFNDVSIDKKNLANAYKTGNAQYPFEIFGDNYSYTFKNSFMKEEITNNKDLLDFLITVIRNNNKTMIYRDVSFLNVNAYQIIIIGMSELFNIDKKTINILSEIKKSNGVMKDVKNANANDLIELIPWMNSYLSYNSRIELMTDLEFKSDSIYSTGSKVFEFFIYLKLKRFNDAHKTLVEYLSTNDISEKRRVLFKCFKEVLEAKNMQMNMDDSEVYTILGKIYSNDLLNYTLNMIQDCSSYFNKFNSINCKDCDVCITKDKCNTNKALNIYIKLIERYKAYVS